MEKALKHLSQLADEAEIYFQEIRSSTITIKNSMVDSYRERKARGYGIRVIMGRRMGFYHANRLGRKELETAVKIARLAQRDEHLKLPARRRSAPPQHPVFQMTLEEGMEMAGELLSAAQEHPGVSVTLGAIAWSSSRAMVANTNGVEGEKEDSILIAHLSTVAGKEEPSTGFYMEVSREKDVDVRAVSEEACRLARDSLHARRISTGLRKVVLKPMAAAELLENTLVQAFNADNVQRGRSRLAGKLGQEVFSGIDIVDDATFATGLMSEPFDDEGVPAQRTSLVEKGVLKGFLYDTYTAAKEGVESTGNAGRTGYSAPPTVSPSNFIISGDERMEEEASGLVVHGLIGAHTSNPVTGDFSCETRNAFLHGAPVKKAIISGNIFDILRSGAAFGEDVKQYSSVVAPSIELPEVMVIG